MFSREVFVYVDSHRNWMLVKSVLQCYGVYFLRTWNMP